ncbi:hypothetical protein MPLB_940014 [Mesorhizobium sp. ORS 3324]|nr:hypothetical protein MPLB_940014 [Mesorhizobium sp. ORS 3324]
MGQELDCRFVGQGMKPEKPPCSLCHQVRLTRPAEVNSAIARWFRCLVVPNCAANLGNAENVSVWQKNRLGWETRGGNCGR